MLSNMKKILNNTDTKQFAVLVLGTLIAVFSVFSPFYQTPDLDDPRQIVHHTDQDQSDAPASDEAEDDLIIKSLDAVPNVVQAGSFSDLSGCFKEFVFETPEAIKQKSRNVSHLTSKYFRTLFRYIISPNAP